MTNHDGGYRLPQVLDPDRCCVVIQVPREQFHIAALVGALTELTYWFNWQRDDLHTGKAVADVWRAIVADVTQQTDYIMANCPEDCANSEFQVVNCALQWRPNPQAQWITISENICGPSGEQGPQGIQGEQGPQGIQGEQGPQGIQGIPGTCEPCTLPEPGPREGNNDAIICLASLNAANALVVTYNEIADRAADYVLNQTITFDQFYQDVGAALLGLLNEIELGAVLFTSGVTLIAIQALYDVSRPTQSDQDDLLCALIQAAYVTDGVVKFDFLALRSALNDLGDADPSAWWGPLIFLVDQIGEQGVNLAGATTAITDADCCVCEGAYCPPPPLCETGLPAEFQEFTFSAEGGAQPAYLTVATGTWRSAFGDILAADIGDRYRLDYTITLSPDPDCFDGWYWYQAVSSALFGLAFSMDLTVTGANGAINVHSDGTAASTTAEILYNMPLTQIGAVQTVRVQAEILTSAAGAVFRHTRAWIQASF